MSNADIDTGLPRKIQFNKDELDKFTKEELVSHFLSQTLYAEYLEKLKGKENDDEKAAGSTHREPEERLRQQQIEATRRENVLVMRLTTKEQELHDYLNQLDELKNSVASGYRNAMLDPAVNILFNKMKQELQMTKEKLEQSQQELNAWKFTPDSQTGKRLMAKCRMLHQENEELGKMISSGRVAKLESDVSVAKNFLEEIKKGQTEIDDFLLEMDEDMEGLQSTVYLLQQQLQGVKMENAQLREQLGAVGLALPRNARSDSRTSNEEVRSPGTPPASPPPGTEAEPPASKRPRHMDHLSSSSSHTTDALLLRSLPQQAPTKKAVNGRTTRGGQRSRTPSSGRDEQINGVTSEDEEEFVLQYEGEDSSH